VSRSVKWRLCEECEYNCTAADDGLCSSCLAVKKALAVRPVPDHAREAAE
jgi:hypothetical protein